MKLREPQTIDQPTIPGWGEAGPARGSAGGHPPSWEGYHSRGCWSGAPGRKPGEPDLIGDAERFRQGATERSGGQNAEGIVGPCSRQVDAPGWPWAEPGGFGLVDFWGPAGVPVAVSGGFPGVYLTVAFFLGQPWARGRRWVRGSCRTVSGRYRTKYAGLDYRVTGSQMPAARILPVRNGANRQTGMEGQDGAGKNNIDRAKRDLI